MTQAEAAKLVAVMLAAFPQSRASAQTSQVYERMLADLDYPAANAAVERLLATARFMPTIAEIRETALALTVGEQKQGGEAWGDVLRMIGRYGARRYDDGWTVPIADPVAARTVAALGWVNLCDSENQAADRARFIELYDRLAIQEKRKQLSEGLPAMQRFRALEDAKRETKRIERGGATSVRSAMGAVFALVPNQTEES